MQIEFFTDDSNEVNDTYSKKIMAPQYVPNSVCPSISMLCDTEKYSQLIRDIKMSNVTEEEKAFLMKAASRHIVFNYAKIADYYAHATPEMQKLMEQSALVIIDIDDAIANGYVELSSTIKQILNAEDLGED